MKKPTKKYIVWVGSGEGYVPTEFDTVEEALIATKYGDDWYLTAVMNYISAYGDFREQPKPKAKETSEPKA